MKGPEIFVDKEVEIIVALGIVGIGLLLRFMDSERLAIFMILFHEKYELVKQIQDASWNQNKDTKKINYMK